jgi:hypothetical protein
MPTFQKKWSGSWMKQWFYVKNDLSEREDVKGVIHRPIRKRFGIRRPSIAGGNKAQSCLLAFNTVCSYIGTRDLVQEHIAFKVWPLVNYWEMPKETAASSSEGGLVYLKYTYRYRSQFSEPNGEWLEAVEATNDELLGAYSKVEDEAMNTALGARGKRRLNKVFDVIGFIYLDYCFLARKQETKRKIASTTSFDVPKAKKTKALTHRPKLHSLERAAALPATEKMEVVEYAEATPSALEIILTEVVEAATAQLEKELESSRAEGQPKLQSPAAMTGLSMAITTSAATPRKGRRMASVLDNVLKPSKVSAPASSKVFEDKIEELGEAVAASTSPACAEAGPSKTKPMEQVKESLPEKLTLPIPEAASHGDFGYIVRHASGKQLS